jgi:hypothetical protein
MTACQASRGQRLGSAPDLPAQQSGLVLQAPTPRPHGLHGARQRLTPLPQCLAGAGKLRRPRSALQPAVHTGHTGAGGVRASLEDDHILHQPCGQRHVPGAGGRECLILLVR